MEETVKGLGTSTWCSCFKEQGNPETEIMIKYLEDDFYLHDGLVYEFQTNSKSQKQHCLRYVCPIRHFRLIQLINIDSRPTPYYYQAYSGKIYHKSDPSVSPVHCPGLQLLENHTDGSALITTTSGSYGKWPGDIKVNPPFSAHSTEKPKRVPAELTIVELPPNAGAGAPTGGAANGSAYGSSIWEPWSGAGAGGGYDGPFSGAADLD